MLLGEESTARERRGEGWRGTLLVAALIVINLAAATVTVVVGLFSRLMLLLSAKVLHLLGGRGQWRHMLGAASGRRGTCGLRGGVCRSGRRDEVGMEFGLVRGPIAAVFVCV